MNEQQLLAALAANPALLAALAAQTEKASAVSPAVIPPHGPNALFNTPGVDPRVISAMVQPLYGLEGLLESKGLVFLSQDLSPLFAVLTGQTASTGDEPTEPCDEDVPVAGDLKVCHQAWQFGELTRKSKVIRVDDAGQLINRAEPLDLRLVNNPFGDVPTPIAVNYGELFRDRLAKALLELMSAMRRDYCDLVYTGNPTNTASSLGGYLEFNGLDRIINTGYRDVLSETLCPAVDSYVASFSNGIVQNSAGTIVRTIVEMIRQQKYLAQQTQMGDVEWALVMRRQLWLSLTDVWPCAYNTYRCSTALPAGSAGTTITISGDENNRLRDEMRNGMYLLIDGERIPVVLDDCMAELNVGAGNFQSDLYLLPLRAGGEPLTYMDYFNYRGPFGMQRLVQEEPMLASHFRVSNDGRYAVAMLSPTAYCVQFMVRTRKRLIVRAPFLAGRLTNIRYNVYNHERSPFPGTSFHANGGNTSFYGTTYESPV